MIPYGRQSISEEDIQAVVDVLKSDWLTQGPKIAEFEEALCKATNAQFAVACSNGTTALHLAFLAAGLKEGDEVITTPNTFVATSNMLLACGVKPVFCDIRLDTYNLDEGKVEALITPKTKAIVTVDFAGQSCDYTVLSEIAKKHGLLLIADAAHALGGEFEGKKIGELADMTLLSFHPVKSITTGEGGAIVTSNKDWADSMRRMRSHGVHKNEQGMNVMTVFGYNYRITDLQAALGTSQLKRLKSFNAHRREVVKWYAEELGTLEDIILPIEKENVKSAWHLYVIRVKDASKRQDLYEHLKKADIQANFHYPAVYNNPYYRNLGFKDQLSNMDLYEETCLTLPCHQQLSREEVKFISDSIKSFFQ